MRVLAVRPARTSATVLLSAVLLAACQSAPPPAGVPARIGAPTAASHAELQRVVATALAHERVTLAMDALTESSTLFVESVAPRGIDAPPATGRQTGRPERFTLLKDGPQCVLVHERTGLRWLLLDTECEAE